MDKLMFEHVRMAFGDKVVHEDLSLSFSSPGRYSVLGPSGRGKTTLLRLIAGLETPQNGRIILPKDLRIAFCFQEDRLLPWKTVLENVSLVCADEERARFWLAQVGLSDEENSYPASRSGGMKRRASLARALAYDADILLMDEPFRALDEQTHAQMLALVRRAAEGRLLLLVTHDEADAEGMEIVRI